MYILSIILGLCAGSFALVLATRMHDKRDWVRGRSECDKCHHVLAWYDLVPLLSWLSTQGRCRYCKKRVGSTYPVVEAGTGVLFGLSTYYWPYGFDALGIVQYALWLVILTVLVALVIFDVKWYLLPDKLVYFLVGVASAQQLFTITYYQSVETLPGIAAGIAVGAGIFYGLYEYSRGKYIGGGDVKYGLFFGILLGSGLKSMVVISLGSLLGTLATIPLIAVKRKKMTSMIPFGPFLIAATVIVYIWGDRLVEIMNTTYLFP